jgi:hypothetical protein
MEREAQSRQYFLDFFLRGDNCRNEESRKKKKWCSRRGCGAFGLPFGAVADSSLASKTRVELARSHLALWARKSRKPIFMICGKMVLEARFELAQPCGHKALNLACLPISPPERVVETGEEHTQ